MKNLKKFCMAIMIAISLVGCKPIKDLPKNDEPLPGPVVTTPCSAEAKDDSEYFRDFGVGTNLNFQSSRDAALQAAQRMIKQRLGGMVTGMTTDYVRTVSGQAPSDKVQRAIETGTDQLIQRMLNDAANICETTIHLNDGKYQTFYAIQISKKELAKECVSVLSEQEELEIEFNRDQFRKYAEKRMAEMKGVQ